MYLAGLNSIVNETTNPAAWEAALITPQSKLTRKPAVVDALEIMKKLAGLTSLV